jgi:hypothetical protein
MQRKQVFPPEPDTQPDILRAKALTNRKGGAGARKTDDRSERPTDPPPAKKGRASVPPRKDGERLSGLRARRPGKTAPAATVDEVVADMSRDPRRERDGDD